MKKQIIIAVSLLLTLSARAQMTLKQSDYSSTQMNVVNLLIHGKKYCVFDDTHGQVRLYNLDHSLWQSINLPASVSGLARAAGDWPMYISENLFKLDNLVDMSLIYLGTGFSSNVVIDATGAVVNIADSVQNITVYNAGVSTDSFVACIQGYYQPIAKVYSLPGTIPCNLCGNGLGLAKVEHPDGGTLSDPTPNPSSGQTKLAFTLPEGSNQGELSIYNTNGDLLKTYKVDKTFGYLTIDNSLLPAGIYYYNLVSDGNITLTKKMVVIK